MKDKLIMLAIGSFGTLIVVAFGVGVSSATWAKKYVEFPRVWAQESEQIQKAWAAEAREEKQQTLLFREMLATQKWDSCIVREEPVEVCKFTQDSLRRVWFVQDSAEIVRDSVRASEGE